MKTSKTIANEFLRRKAQEETEDLEDEKTDPSLRKIVEKTLAELKAEEEAELKAEKEAELKAEKEAELKAEKEAEEEAELKAEKEAELEAELEAEQSPEIKKSPEKVPDKEDTKNEWVGFLIALLTVFGGAYAIEKIPSLKKLLSGESSNPSSGVVGVAEMFKDRK